MELLPVVTLGLGIQLEQMYVLDSASSSSGSSLSEGGGWSESTGEEEDYDTANEGIESGGSPPSLLMREKGGFGIKFENFKWESNHFEERGGIGMTSQEMEKEEFERSKTRSGSGNHLLKPGGPRGTTSSTTNPILPPPPLPIRTSSLRYIPEWRSRPSSSCAPSNPSSSHLAAITIPSSSSSTLVPSSNTPERTPTPPPVQRRPVSENPISRHKRLSSLFGFGPPPIRRSTSCLARPISIMFPPPPSPKISRVINSQKSHPSCPSLRSSEFQKQAILNELLITERNFIAELLSLEENFGVPIRAFRKQREVDRGVARLFTCVPGMRAVHELLLLNWGEESRVISVREIITIFRDVLERLTEAHLPFLVQLGGSTGMLKELNREIGVGRFIKEREKEIRGFELGLEAFLLKPVQRLCKVCHPLHPFLFTSTRN